jgi:hypothetical protein
MDLEFGFYWDWIDAQANNFLAPFLPEQQLSFSLSPSKQLFKIGLKKSGG